MFKVDDQLPFHPKIVQAGNAAMGLWVRAGTWCAAHLTDGAIPDHMVRQLGTHTQAEALVAANLWYRTGSGYQFHDWEDHQPSAKEARAARRTMSSSGRIGNHRRWHEDRGIVDPDCPYCDKSRRTRVRVPDRVPESGPESPVPVPTQPDTSDEPNGPSEPSNWADHLPPSVTALRPKPQREGSRGDPDHGRADPGRGNW